MRHISAHELRGEQKKKREESTRSLYKKVLSDPSSSESTKREARRRLEISRSQLGADCDYPAAFRSQTLKFL